MGRKRAKKKVNMTVKVKVIVKEAQIVSSASLPVTKRKRVWVSIAN